MRTLLWILGLLLAGWLLFTITVKCDNTKSIPYCVGWSVKTMVTDIVSGFSD
jgi:hypothetical protein